MKKKPSKQSKRRSLFHTIAGAVVGAIGRGGTTTGVEPTPPTPIIDKLKTGPSFPNPTKGANMPDEGIGITKTWGGMSFVQHMMDTYGGEFHGRSFPKEKFEKPLEELVKAALRDPGKPTSVGRIQDRCPNCGTFLMLGKPGATDTCPVCDKWLLVVERTLTVPDIHAEGGKREITHSAFEFAHHKQPLCCAKCSTPITELRGIILGQNIQENDLFFCGQCTAVNKYIDQRMVLLTEEELSTLSADEQRDIKFAIRMCVAKIKKEQDEKPKPLDKPIV